jgi:hypothetical protein
MAYFSKRAQTAARSHRSGSGVRMEIDGFPSQNQIALALKGKLQEEFDEINEDLAAAQLEAADAVAQRGKEIMRGDMAGSGFRNAKRLAKTWRHKAFAFSRANKDDGPQGIIWSSAPEIVAAFDDGGTIEAFGKGFLMIPFGRAKVIYRQTKSWKNRRGSGGQFEKALPWLPQVERRLNVIIKPIFAKDMQSAVLVAQTGGRAIRGTRSTNRDLAPRKEVLGFLVKEVRPGRRMRGRALLRKVLAEGEKVMGEEFGMAFARRRAARGGDQGLYLT